LNSAVLRALVTGEDEHAIQTRAVTFGEDLQVERDGYVRRQLLGRCRQRCRTHSMHHAARPATTSCQYQDVNTSAPSDRRLRIAAEAFDLIERELRPFLASGGRLWSKGSQGYPARLRKMLAPLDTAHQVTFGTPAAMELDERQRVVEHVVPMKRIIIEIVDPAQADPRANSRFAPLAGGPASTPEQLLAIFDTLLVKCWVTPEEHDLLNRAGQSLQWDAPNGDGWARYRLAGVDARPIG